MPLLTALRTISLDELNKLIRKVSSFLHDARVVRARLSPDEGVVQLLLKRIGYEHGYILSNGWWGFGRRWMYPWVECTLTIAHVSSMHEKQHVADVEDFDSVMTLRLDANRLTIHREFSDITMELVSESTLDLRDTGGSVNRAEGMVFYSRTPLDLSDIEELLE